MIIVSQEKDEIINFDNIVRLSVSNNLEGQYLIEAHNFCDDFETVIGIYKTDERAKEVMNEIRKVHKCSESYKYTRDFITQSGIVERMEKENLKVFTYEMPEE